VVEGREADYLSTIDEAKAPNLARSWISIESAQEPVEEHSVESVGSC